MACERLFWYQSNEPLLNFKEAHGAHCTIRVFESMAELILQAENEVPEEISLQCIQGFILALTSTNEGHLNGRRYNEGGQQANHLTLDEGACSILLTRSYKDGTASAASTSHDACWENWRCRSALDHGNDMEQGTRLLRVISYIPYY